MGARLWLNGVHPVCIYEAQTLMRGQDVRQRPMRRNGLSLFHFRVLTADGEAVERVVFSKVNKVRHLNGLKQ